MRKVDLALDEPKYCCLGSIWLWKNFTIADDYGHEVISSGSVLINGQDVSEKPPSLRPTSMMFQNYALFPHLKVIDNVAFAQNIWNGQAHKTWSRYAMLRGVQLENLQIDFQTNYLVGSSNGLRLLAL